MYHVSQKYIGSILGSWIHRWLCPDVAHRSLWLGLDKLRRFQKQVYHKSQKYSWSILGSWSQRCLSPDVAHRSLWLVLDKLRRFQNLVYHVSQVIFKLLSKTDVTFTKVKGQVSTYMGTGRRLEGGPSGDESENFGEPSPLDDFAEGGWFSAAGAAIFPQITPQVKRFWPFFTNKLPPGWKNVCSPPLPGRQRGKFLGPRQIDTWLKIFQSKSGQKFWENLEELVGTWRDPLGYLKTLRTL